MKFALRSYQTDAIDSARMALRKCRAVILKLATGCGKAQPVTAKVLTRTGFVPIGSVSVGDKVIGSDGDAHNVTGVFPQGTKRIFKIDFSDGSSTRCCEDHLWSIQTKSQKHRMAGFKTVKLKDIGKLTDGFGFKWFLPIVRPVLFTGLAELQVEPYLLGALLGDGSFRGCAIRLSSVDEFILNKVQARLPAHHSLKHVDGCDWVISSGGSNGGSRNNELKQHIIDLGLWEKYSHEKFIPRHYKYAPIAARLELLRGLMDTDGSVSKSNKRCEFSTTSRALADDVCEIVRSLGGCTCVQVKKPGRFTHNGVAKIGKVSYRVRVSIHDNPFSLPRKAALHAKDVKYGRTKAIKSITECGSEECVCISVDTEDRLYVTDNYVLTHNTIIAAGITKAAAEKGNRVLFLAHTNELIEQGADKISRAAGVDYAIEKAERTAHDAFAPLVVASVQSLTRPKRLARYPKDHFGVILTDEVHRGAADSYTRIYDHFDKAKLVGLTATPFRGDSKSLGDVYDEVCFDYGMDKAIEDGFLVPIVSETIPLEIDISKAKIVNGEYKPSDIEDAITPIMEAVAAKLKEKAGDRKICVFCPVISASKRFTNILREHGFDAEHVDGKSPDRDEIIKRFSEKGPGSAICNSQLLCEGWDEPSVDCVVVLSPVRSTLRYIQMVGRGTRTVCDIHDPAMTAAERRLAISLSEKPNLYVPDFLWLGAQHNLCHPASLVAKTPEVAEKMVSMQKAGGCKDLQQLEEEAHKSLVSEREEALAQNLKSFIGSKSKKFDPVLQSISLIDDSLVDWKPETKSEARPATAAQIKKLERHGFDASGWKSGYAEKIIESVDERFKKGLATPKQIRCLLRNDHPKAQNYTRKQADEAMNKLAKKWEKSKKWKKKK